MQGTCSAEESNSIFLQLCYCGFFQLAFVYGRGSGSSPVVSMVAGYWWVPAGTRTLCSGEYLMRYSKSVLLSGSPYSVSHACPASGEGFSVTSNFQAPSFLVACPLLLRLLCHSGMPFATMQEYRRSSQALCWDLLRRLCGSAWSRLPDMSAGTHRW